MLSHFFHAQSQLFLFLSDLKPQEVPVNFRINLFNMVETLV